MDDQATAFGERARQAHGIDVELHEVTTGAEQSRVAEQLGCEPGQVARSVVLFADVLLVALVGGSREVDNRAVATLRGVHEARLADPEEFEERLGWPEGGVPPFCHERSVLVFLDDSLTDYETVWVPAGAPTAVFSIAPETLLECADAAVADISR